MKTVFDELRALHRPFKIYDECRHDHNEMPGVNLVYVEDVGEVCEEGYMYSICRECCCGGSDYQSEECAGEHLHGKDKPICKTAALLDKHATPERIAELRALEKAATPGPWEIGNLDFSNAVDVTGEITPDMAFCIAARNELPRLLDAIEGLRYTADQRLADMMAAEAKLDAAQATIERVRGICDESSGDDIDGAWDGGWQAAIDAVHVALEGRSS